ncbi:MAG: MBL fold metallo-hydrolase, partial [Promethearchaeota archaeon]
ENLKAIALTHCHIDHSGALPFLYKNLSVPLFTNPITLKIVEILIKDMLEISNFSYPFGLRELHKVLQNSYYLNNRKRKKISENFYITFLNAGHIPGSVSILLEIDKKTILYSGDINNQHTNLVNPAISLDLPKLDMLIVESTYALKNHPPRVELEKKFVEKVINITENGGRVLIPAFGVARSQEALLILQKYNYKGTIFIDGMARKICNLYLEHPEFLKSIESYQNALKKAKFISSKKGRNFARNSNGVIIAPSGMLKGGAAIDFIKSFLCDPDSAIYLIGYQVEGSPGRRLLDEGIIDFNEKNKKKKIKDFKIKAECEYEYFDFSSHADGEHIHKYIENLKFKNNSRTILCVHGDSKVTTTFASELIKKSCISVAPEIGESYKL